MNKDLFFQRLAFASLIILPFGFFAGIVMVIINHVLIVFSGTWFFLKSIQGFDLRKINLSVFFLDMLSLAIVFSVFANWSEIEEPHRHLSKVKYFLCALLGIFAYREIFRAYLDEKKKSFLIHLVLLVSVAATVSGLIGLYTGFNPARMSEACSPSRSCGITGIMSYAHIMSLFMILLTGAILYREELKRYINPNFLFIAWAINLIGLYFSFTRGAWLAFLVGVPFFFFKKNKKKFLLFSGIGILFVSILFAFFLGSRPDKYESDKMRISFFQAAIRAFQEKPVLGWGHQNFRPNVNEIKKRYGIAFSEPEHIGGTHNNYLEYLSGTGIVGFMALLLWNFYWGLESFRGRNLMARLTFPFVIGFVIGGLTHDSFTDAENLFFILNVWALARFLIGVVGRPLP